MRTCYAIIALSFGALSVLSAMAAEQPVTAEPNHVKFSRLEDSVTFSLRKGNEVIQSKAVKSVRVKIDERDYTHQFAITKSATGPAKITVAPNPKEAQAGTFSLVISTKSGDAIVAIEMPLDGLPDTLENKAASEGKTVEEKKAELGLSHEGQRETVAVRLPQWQYEGSTFTLRIPIGPGVDIAWKVDGQPVQSGKDQNVLKHVMDSVGDHRIDMEARKGDAVVAQWSGVIRIIAYPDMTLQWRAKQKNALRGPRGYKSHDWSIDGHSEGSGDELRHSFKSPGNHIIECVSREPIIGEAGEYKRSVWKISVK